jgi:hypothetical protein
MVVESEGRKILLLDTDIARLLDERTIDYLEAPEGAGFIITKADPRK